MNWEDLLLNQLSQEMITYMITEIEKKPALFDDLYPNLFSENERLAWRTGYVLCHLQKNNAALLNPKLNELAQHVLKTTFHGVRRSLLSIIHNSSYQDFNVDFINQLFEWMLSPKQDVSIQVYSMYILLKVTAIYPDFKEELIALLENVEAHNYTKGFNAARMKTLVQLTKKKTTRMRSTKKCV